LENRKKIKTETLDPKEQEQAQSDEEYRLFLETEAFLC
jgi:hypothetical protein